MRKPVLIRGVALAATSTKMGTAFWLVLCGMIGTGRCLIPVVVCPFFLEEHHLAGAPYYGSYLSKNIIFNTSPRLDVEPVRHRTENWKRR